MPGKLIALHICRGHREPMDLVQEAVAISELGLEGDRHAMEGSPRQVLLMDKETLDGLELAPGMIRENLTLEGLELGSLNEGQVLRVGSEVSLQTTGPCIGCERMDEIRPGLRDDLVGRPGVLAVVLSGGTLRVGDTVKVE